MKIVMIVGLPGSGKTHLGDKMRIPFFDDFSLIGKEDFLKAIGNFNIPKIAVADVFLCREKDRIAAEKWLKETFPDVELEWIFFENSPEKCYKNVERRIKEGDGRKVQGLIKILSECYSIPDGVETIKVYENEVASQ